MTSPARLSSAAMSVRHSRTRVRSGDALLRNRLAAWALLRIAARGWLTWCTIEAVSSPMVGDFVEVLALCDIRPPSLGNVLAGAKYVRWQACLIPQHLKITTCRPHVTI